jgi:hypothetical protein
MRWARGHAAVARGAATTWGSERRAAATATLTVAEDRQAAVESLLGIADSTVVEAALGGLEQAEVGREQVEIVLPLLRHEDLAIRDAATDFAVAHLKRAQLPKLLGIYSRGQYYYRRRSVAGSGRRAPRQSGSLCRSGDLC